MIFPRLLSTIVDTFVSDGLPEYVKIGFYSKKKHEQFAVVVINSSCFQAYTEFYDYTLSFCSGKQTNRYKGVKRKKYTVALFCSFFEPIVAVAIVIWTIIIIIIIIILTIIIRIRITIIICVYSS